MCSRQVAGAMVCIVTERSAKTQCREYASYLDGDRVNDLELRRWSDPLDEDHRDRSASQPASTTVPSGKAPAHLPSHAQGNGIRPLLAVPLCVLRDPGCASCHGRLAQPYLVAASSKRRFKLHSSIITVRFTCTRQVLYLADSIPLDLWA